MWVRVPSSVPNSKKKTLQSVFFFVCYLWRSCRPVGRIRRLRRHPTLLQRLMALRLSGLQTLYIPRIKKAAFAALRWCIFTSPYFPDSQPAAGRLWKKRSADQTAHSRTASRGYR
ncbi:hypothetical protein FDK32_14130 [Citrobacter freundii]|nr:hypothetical protein [Citrobacter freundii]TKU46507.1 hypothetical protein FDX08_23775 [Citrobacter sp. wls712]